MASSMLWAGALAIGNTVVVEIKASFREYACIFLALVGHPGTNKSAPLTFALAPFVEADKKAFAEFKIAFAAYEAEQREAKGKDRDNPEPPPILKKFLFNDFTIEALAKLHSDNPVGIGVYQDELAGWIKNFDRYNRGSQQEFWLSTWSGKSYTIDRKSGPPIANYCPFIPVVGTVQPAIINELGGNGRAQNGFWDRILFAYPQNLRKEPWSDSELPHETISAYALIIQRLINRRGQIEFESPVVLQFSKKAKKALYAWQSANTVAWNDTGSERMKGKLAKMDIYVCRIALILHCLEGACSDSFPEAIGFKTVQNAIEITEYFTTTAAVILEENSATSIESLPVNKRQIYESLPSEFSTSEGIKLAGEYEMKERSFKEWLHDTRFFKRLSHGTYQKTI